MVEKVEISQPYEITQSWKTRKLYMIGHAHIDPVWLWRWQEGFQEVKATFRSALDRMKEYEDFIFISSSAAFYEWLEQSDPGTFAEIQQRVAEGRWGLVGGWWVEADCNIPSGESFVRQALLAQRYFKSKFGKIARVGFNPDSFGHAGSLPQILLKSGLENYVFMRPMPHEKGLPGRLFWWESDDGSRVLAYRLPYEYCTWGKSLEDHIGRVAAEIRSPQGEQLCFYGVGNHGGGPTRENIESILRMDEDPTLPELSFSTPDEFFIAQRSAGTHIPVAHTDLQHHASGCYSAYSDIKRWNRRSENQLLTAEKWASLASWVTNQPYPAELRQAWKDVLFNQFHDVLAGTCLESAYEDARDLYGEANAIAGRAVNLATQSIAWKIRIPDDSVRSCIVFNPHAWACRLPVELELSSHPEGSVLLDSQDQVVPYQCIQSKSTAVGRQRVCFQAELPGMGYAVYRFAEGDQSVVFTDILAIGTSLENSLLRLEVDPETGFISSLYDKRAEVETFQAEAARPVVLDDPGDTWGHNLFRWDQVLGEFKIRSICLVENGPVRVALRVESDYGSSRLIQDFCLYSGSAQVDVHARLEWREARRMMKLRFPLNLNHMRSINEIPYGSIERFANGEEQPGQSWVDVSGLSKDNDRPFGFSLLNDGCYSFDVNIRDLGMTVLRSPIYAHHMPVEPQPGGDYTYMDQGWHEFNYSLLPHGSSWETAGTVRRAAELNQAAIVLPATLNPTGSLPNRSAYLWAEPENIQVTALKRAEEGDDLILRAFESSKAETQAILHLDFYGRVIEAQFSPNEIKTFRIPRDPVKPVIETGLLEWDQA